MFVSPQNEKRQTRKGQRRAGVDYSSPILVGGVIFSPVSDKRRIEPFLESNKIEIRVNVYMPFTFKRQCILKRPNEIFKYL